MNRRISPPSRRTRSAASLAAAALALTAFAALPARADAPASAADAAWVAPARAARKPNPLATDASAAAKGKALFAGACQACHGAHGEGDGPAGALLERNGRKIRPRNLTDPELQQQSDGVLFWKISEGRTPMPSFQATYSEEQRWQIVSFLRTLAPSADAARDKTLRGDH